MNICEHCQYKDTPAQSASWRLWYCKARPKATPVQFCTEEPFLYEAPFYFCRDLNPDGRCLHFEERKDDGEC